MEKKMDSGKREGGWDLSKGFEVGDDADQDEAELTSEQEERARAKMANDRSISWGRAVNMVRKEDKEKEGTDSK